MKQCRQLRLTIFLSAVLVAGCSRDQLLDPKSSPPLATILDGARGGNPRFFWLQPTVATAPSYSGIFDITVLDRLKVEICELNAQGACVRTLTTLTSTGTPFSARIRMDGVRQHYLVYWNTSGFTVNANTFYRARVLLDDYPIGQVDIDVVPTRAMLGTVNSSLYTGVALNEQLTLRFRVEQGALFEDEVIGQAGGQLVHAVGATVTVAPGIIPDGTRVSALLVPTPWPSGSPISEAFTISFEAPSDLPDEIPIVIALRLHSPLTQSDAPEVRLLIDGATVFASQTTVAPNGLAVSFPLRIPVDASGATPGVVPRRRGPFDPMFGAAVAAPLQKRISVQILKQEASPCPDHQYLLKKNQRVRSSGLGSAVPVVFVHGLQLGQNSCGEHAAHMNQLLGAGDSVFKYLVRAGLTHSSQFYSYTYPTHLSIDVGAQRLAQALIDEFGIRSDIILVGHSLGGLVARRARGYLLQTNSATGIARIYTLGTPHNGTPLETLKGLTHWPWNPAAASLLQLRTQPNSYLLGLDALDASASLRTAVHSYAGVNVPRQRCTYAPFVCAFYEKADLGMILGGHGLNDGMVPQSSALLANSDTASYTGYNHSEVKDGNEEFVGTDALLTDVTHSIAQYISQVDIDPSVLVIDLGTLGGNSAAATDVNSRGEIVGWAENPAGVRHGFLWTQGSLMLDLDPGQNRASFAVSINESGQVAGYVQTGLTPNNSPLYRPFIWTSAAGLQVLAPPTACSVWTEDMNNNGDLLVTTGPACFPPQTSKVWVYETATSNWVNVGDLGFGVQAHTITDSGRVYGRVPKCNNGCFNDFVWDKQSGLNVINITHPGGGGGEIIHRVNDAGLAVGSYNTGFGPRPLLWDLAGQKQISACSAPLIPGGVPGGTAYGLDDTPFVVGYAVFPIGPASSASHGFFCNPGFLMVDLGALPSHSSSKAVSVALNNGGAEAWAVGESVLHAAGTIRAQRAVLWILK